MNKQEICYRCLKELKPGDSIGVLNCHHFVCDDCLKGQMIFCGQCPDDSEPIDISKIIFLTLSESKRTKRSFEEMNEEDREDEEEFPDYGITNYKRIKPLIDQVDPSTKEFIKESRKILDETSKTLLELLEKQKNESMAIKMQINEQTEKLIFLINERREHALKSLEAQLEKKDEEYLMIQTGFDFLSRGYEKILLGSPCPIVLDIKPYESKVQEFIIESRKKEDILRGDVSNLKYLNMKFENSEFLKLWNFTKNFNFFQSSPQGIKYNMPTRNIHLKPTNMIFNERETFFMDKYPCRQFFSGLNSRPELLFCLFESTNDHTSIINTYLLNKEFDHATLIKKVIVKLKSITSFVLLDDNKYYCAGLDEDGLTIGIIPADVFLNQDHGVPNLVQLQECPQISITFSTRVSPAPFQKITKLLAGKDGNFYAFYKYVQTFEVNSQISIKFSPTNKTTNYGTQRLSTSGQLIENLTDDGIFLYKTSKSFVLGWKSRTGKSMGIGKKRFIGLDGSGHLVFWDEKQNQLNFFAFNEDLNFIELEKFNIGEVNLTRDPFILAGNIFVPKFIRTDY